jgi:hypothetical protein
VRTKRVRYLRSGQLESSSELDANFGLRWEVQLPFEALNDTFAQVSYEGLYGESGVGNSVQTGVVPGAPSTYAFLVKAIRPIRQTTAIRADIRFRLDP